MSETGLVNLGLDKNFLSRRADGPQFPKVELYGVNVKAACYAVLQVFIGKQPETDAPFTLNLYVAKDKEDVDGVDIDLSTSTNLKALAGLFEQIVLPVSWMIRYMASDNLIEACIAQAIVLKQPLIRVEDNQLTGDVKFVLDLGGAFLLEGEVKREEVMEIFKWSPVMLTSLCS